MKIAFLSTALLASGAALAATPIPGWYNSVFAGYTGIVDILGNTRGVLARDFAGYNGGYNVGGRFGYQCDPLRFELELTYLHAGLRHFRINHFAQEAVHGSTWGWFGMGNVYYDFPDMVTAVSPFLGIGVGYGWVGGSFQGIDPFFGRLSFRETSSTFAYQATGGFTYNFAENYAINIAYRYLGTGRLDDIGKILQAHMGSIGIIYRFDEADYK